MAGASCAAAQIVTAMLVGSDDWLAHLSNFIFVVADPRLAEIFSVAVEQCVIAVETMLGGIVIIWPS